MGAKNSRDVSWRGSSFGSGSSSHGHYDYPPSSYTQQNQNYASQDQFPPQQPYYAPPPENFGSRVPDPRRKFDRRFSRIADNYNSLEQVTEALARAGLESSNLIVGIDFTKSNEWTGAKSFNRQSLHHIGSTQNPYEQAISILGRTLIAFDEDNLIPCFGFGDASTHDQDVFSFYPDERPCNGFEEALEHYREIVPHLRLAGPTSFAPIIEMAMTIVEQSGGQYHVLLIIADGQVTRSVDTNHGQLSPQEQKTVDAIVKASEYPLSIILVGVGDGPWDTMKEFDDNIPARAFDNFQFVNFTEIMLKNVPVSRKETEFALAALMEIPTQYKATIELNILGRRRGEAPDRVPLPPPLYGTASFGNQKPYHSNSFQQNAPPYYGRDTSVGTAPAPPYYGHDTTVGTTPAPPYHGHDSRPPRSSSFQQSASPYYERDTAVGTAPAQPYYGHDTAVDTAPTPHYGHGTAVGTAPPESTTAFDDQICPICFSNPKNMAFGCGHQTCCECGQDLVSCPICRSTIQTRIKLY